MEFNPRLLLTAALLALFFLATPSEARCKYATRKEKCLSQEHLVSVIVPTTGNSVNGVVHFTPVWQMGSKGWHVCNVRIKAMVSGLSPGKHGFHIHTYGDLRSPDGSSTGGHFTNPNGLPSSHGYPDSDTRHWGDFGNLDADASGVATYNRVDSVITLKGIVGRGMTLHAGEDQGPASQPSGGSGSRVAFGIIGYKNKDA